MPRTLLADEPPPAAAIEGGEAAVAEWKASLLAHWMDQLNFSAQHPAGDDPSRWPAPEGMLGPIPPELPPIARTWQAKRRAGRALRCYVVCSVERM